MDQIPCLERKLFNLSIFNREKSILKVSTTKTKVVWLMKGQFLGFIF